MKRVLAAIMKTYTESLNIKQLIYLNDFLLLGSKDNLNLLVSRLLDSNFMFNLKKCDITPTKKLTYLRVTVDLDSVIKEVTRDKPKSKMLFKVFRSMGFT